MACRLADGRRPADFGTGELSSQPTHPESQLIDFFLKAIDFFPFSGEC
jgi:hypothetical protein